MNSIKYAYDLNNQGVDLLVSGDYSKAMKAFQSALSLLKAAHEAETTSISCDDASASRPFYESTSTVPALQGLPCYVYDHGIMISDNANADTGETLSLYIAIVLFNSALAYHSEGTALGREKSRMKACMLYGLVVKFLTRWTMLEEMSTTIMTLLALNNKAQIHYDQCEYVHSADCIKQISIIMGSVRGLHSALNHEDINGLVLNAMLLSKPTAAHAA
jgi:tetratricopeptide (TPR) repeat protein